MGNQQVSGRVGDAEQALVSDHAPAGRDPSGFDPSRAWRTDTPPFERRPIYQFVLLEGFQEHSGRTWHRLFAGTASISNAADNRWGYRREDIDRIQRDGDMICVERIKGWVPATWPRWDWFTPASVDTHPEDGDALAAPLVSGAVAQPDAQNHAPTPPKDNHNG